MIRSEHLVLLHKVLGSDIKLTFSPESFKLLYQATCWRWAPAALPEALFPWLGRLLWEEKGCQGRLEPLLDVRSKGCKPAQQNGAKGGGWWQGRGSRRGISCSES